MHGGGLSDGARMVVRAETPLQEEADYARRIMGIEEEFPDPQQPRTHGGSRRCRERFVAQRAERCFEARRRLWGQIKDFPSGAGVRGLLRGA